MTDPYNVLLQCTGNSARSIIAEAIMKREGDGSVWAYSGGAGPKGEVHPLTLKLLKRLASDTSFAGSKSRSECASADAPKLNFVLAVCANPTNEICPVWHGQPMTAHWGVPAPTAAEGTDAEVEFAFSEAYRILRNRITVFANLPLASLNHPTLQGKLDEIGTVR